MINGQRIPRDFWRVMLFLIRNFSKTKKTEYFVKNSWYKKMFLNFEEFCRKKMLNSKNVEWQNLFWSRAQGLKNFCEVLFSIHYLWIAPLFTFKIYDEIFYFQPGMFKNESIYIRSEILYSNFNIIWKL